MRHTGIIVLSGESGSGKTTVCEHLVTWCRERDLDVAGILTPPRFEQGEKVGIDVKDIRSGERRALAGRASKGGGLVIGRWHFRPEALEWGKEILEHACPCSLLIVDELGPHEIIRGQGWVNAIGLLRRRKSRAIVVVRPALLEQLQLLLDGIELKIIHVTRTNQDDVLAQLVSLVEGDE